MFKKFGFGSKKDTGQERPSEDLLNAQMEADKAQACALYLRSMDEHLEGFLNSRGRNATYEDWISNLHRVANPPEGSEPSERVVLAFFTGPRDDAIIECLPSCVSEGNPARYGPISAGDHLWRKLCASNV